MREFLRGNEISDRTEARYAQRLRSIVLAPESPATGRALGELDLGGVTVTALVRRDERRLARPTTRVCWRMTSSLRPARSTTSNGRNERCWDRSEFLQGSTR